MTHVGKLRRAPGDDGLVTLELGLLLPWVLVLFFGAITLGQGYRVRHALRGKAYELARACALMGKSDGERCQDLAEQILRTTPAPAWSQACHGQADTWQLRVRAATQTSVEAGGPPVTILLPDPEGAGDPAAGAPGKRPWWASLWELGGLYAAHNVAPPAGPGPDPLADPDGPEWAWRRSVGDNGAMSTQVTVELTCAFAGPLALGEIMAGADMPEDLFTKRIEAQATTSFARTTF